MNKRVPIIVSLLIMSVLGKAQIPNNSFENWTTVNGYQTPANWDNLNQITYGSGIYTCNQGTPGYSGASYLFLISKITSGKALVPSVVPGIAVCGEIDTITYTPKSGFPFSNRPQNLSYYLQYMPYDPSDSSSVKILLTKWNQIQLKRDTIAYGASYFNSMAHTWFYHDTYLNYFSGDNPDSAIIIISSSSSIPKEGSYICLDNLQFNGNVIGVDENHLITNSISISPNPSDGSETITVNIGSNNGFPMELIIYDCIGKLISKTLISSQNDILNLSYGSKGIYTVQIKSKKNTVTKKLILN